MTDSKFTPADKWYGGFYELSLEVTTHSPEKRYSILQTLWRHPFLKGCYLHQDKEPVEQLLVAPGDEHIERGCHLYGLAMMPNGIEIVCGTVFTGPDDDVWLNFYLPMGSLAFAYPVGGFPFGEIDTELHQQWRDAVDTWLAEIGQHIYKTTKFPLGLIGLEVVVFSETNAATIAVNGIPEQREIGYLWPEAGELHYYPRS